MDIFSNIESGKLLHKIIRKRDIQPGRTNISPNEQFMQCALLRLPKDTTFKTHKHNWKPNDQPVIAQESWAVIRGTVKIWLYDLDDKLIHQDVLTAGDISFSYEGGHNYQIMSDDSLVYEYKTGPYVDQQTDKTFINV